MRKYTTEIDIKELVSFIDKEMKQQGTDLNWRLDLWVCEQLQEAYPEVDFAFELTEANAPVGTIEISVDFDIDEYRRVLHRAKAEKKAKDIKAKLKEVK